MRKRILIIGDSARVSTGYGVVCKRIGNQLFDNENFEVKQIGIFDRAAGDNKNGVNFEVIPTRYSMTPGQDRHGDKTFDEVVREFCPHIVITVGDPWHLYYIGAHKIKNKFKWLSYVPVDGDPYPRVMPYNGKWLRLADVTDKPDYVIAFNKFGKNTLEKAGVKVHEVINHGVDIDLFRPLENKKEFKKRYFAKNVKEPEDAIIFGFIGRNQFRKNLPSLLKAWKIFIEKYKPNKKCYLYFHTPNNDTFRGFNLPEIIDTLGVPDDTIILPEHLMSGVGISETDLNKLYNSFDCFVTGTMGEGWCLLPGQKIITNNGTKNIEDIKSGDKVLTHTGRFKKVTQLLSRKIDEEISVIKAYNTNKEIKLTKNHQVYSMSRPKNKYKKNKDWLGELSWRESDKINKGDVVSFPKISEEETIYDDIIIDLKDLDDNILYDDNYVWYKSGYDKISGKIKKYNRFIEYDEKMAYVHGWYIAEGSTYSKEESSIEFSLSGGEADVAMKIQDVLLDKFNVHANIKKLDGKYVTTVRAYGKILSLYFKQFGRGSNNKTLPLMYIVNHRKDLLRKTLSSYWSGDGSFSGKRTRISTSSERMKNDLILIFSILDYKFSISKESRAEQYEISFHKNKNNSHSNKMWSTDTDYRLLVKDTKVEKYSGIVYNLSVEDDNSYCTDGFVVHNCLPGLEAMAAGTHTIMPNYSGHLEYAEGTSWLTNIKDYIVETVSGINRAIIDENHLASQMNDFVNLSIKDRKILIDSHVKKAKKFQWINVNKKWVDLIEGIDVVDYSFNKEDFLLKPQDSIFVEQDGKYKIVASPIDISVSPKNSPKIGFVSTYNEKCGIATYTKNLKNSIESVFEEKNGVIFSELADYNILFKQIINSNVDILHWQHEPGIIAYDNTIMRFLMDLKKVRPNLKNVFTLHAVHPVIKSNIDGFADYIIMHSNKDDYVLMHTKSSIIDHPLPKYEVSENDRIEFRKKLNFDGKTVIGFNGFLTPSKGLDSILKYVGEYIKNNKNIVLYFLNSMPESPQAIMSSERLLGSMNDIIKEMGIKDNVVIDTTFYSKEDMSKRIQTFDIGCCYIGGETMSQSGSIAEIVANQVPVLASNVGHFSHMIKNNFAIPVNDGGSVENFSNSIIELIESQIFDNVIKKTRDNIVKNIDRFSYDNFAISHMNIYNSLIDVRAGGITEPADTESFQGEV